MKRLYRSEENKIVGGIMGGVGEYFGVDPVLVRLGWVIILFVTGVIPGVIAYLVALLIVPKRPEHVIHMHSEGSAYRSSEDK